MKPILLSFLLLILPYFALASLKREKEDILKEEQESGYSSSSQVTDENPTKRPRHGQCVINPRRVQSTATIPELLKQYIWADPSVQAILGSSSWVGHEFLKENQLYQELLAHNFGMEGFKKLPLHSDLKVFENFQFPHSFEGKADALVLVYKITKHVLENSPAHDQLIEIVYDEAAELARNSEQNFKKFVEFSNFHTRTDELPQIVSHFVKKDDVGALFDLGFDWPSLIRNDEFSLELFSENQFSVIVVSFAKHFTSKPEDFTRFFSTSISPRICLCLLLSDLPMTTVVSLASTLVGSQDLYKFFKLLMEIFMYDFDSSFASNQLFGARMLEFIEYHSFMFAKYHEGFTESVRKSLLFCKHLAKFRYENYLFTESDIQNFDQISDDTLKNLQSTILISLGKWDEAISFLPVNAGEPLLVKISGNAEFCALLAERAPEWIKENFSSAIELIFKNRSLFLTAFGTLTSFCLNASNDDLLLASPLILSHFSIEEIRDYITHVVEIDDSLLVILYDNFLQRDIESSRFVQIMDIFMTFEDIDEGEIDAGFFELSADNFWAIYEAKGIELVEKIYHNSWKTDNFLCSRLLHTILQSEHLRPKLMAAKPELLAGSLNDDVKPVIWLYAPTEIYHAFQFFNLDRVDYLKSVLIFLYKRYDGIYEDEIEDFLEYFVCLIAVSRAWFSADVKIAKYSGEDFTAEVLEDADEAEKELCISLMASLSKSGRASLKHVFAELKHIKSVIA